LQVASGFARRRAACNNWKNAPVAALSRRIISPTFLLACFFLLLFLLAAIGCGTVKVKTASAPDVDLQRYHTFNFQPSATGVNRAPLSPLNQQRVQGGIRQELEDRGLALSDQPDLLVRFYLKTKPKTLDVKEAARQDGSIAEVMASYYGFYYRSGEDLSEQGQIRYREGTLVVSLIDRKRNQLVWRGLAKGALYRNESDEQVRARIHESVHSMFEQFPG
jgi:hypothetical protein